MIVVFGFHNGNRVIGTDIKHIVRTLRLLTNDKVAFKVDATICHFGFHRDVLNIPLCCNGRGDVVEFDIFLRHLLF